MKLIVGVYTKFHIKLLYGYYTLKSCTLIGVVLQLPIVHSIGQYLDHLIEERMIYKEGINKSSINTEDCSLLMGLGL